MYVTSANMRFWSLRPRLYRKHAGYVRRNDSMQSLCKSVCPCDLRIRSRANYYYYYYFRCYYYYYYYYYYGVKCDGHWVRGIKACHYNIMIMCIILDATVRWHMYSGYSIKKKYICIYSVTISHYTYAYKHLHDILYTICYAKTSHCK